MSGDDDLGRLTTQVQRLADTQAIVELHDRFGAVLDALDYARLRELFAENAVVEGWDDQPWEGTAQITRRLAEINSDHVGSHRMITNHRIRVDGDRARCVAHYRSAHLDADATPGPIYKPTHSHEGWYLTELRRADHGWRFSRLVHVSLTRADSATPEGRATMAEVLAFVPL
jgi:ketosteroid isomerase-like protein